MKNENVQDQVLKFGAAVLEALPSNIDTVTMKGWTDNPKSLKKFLGGLCPPANVANAAEKSGIKGFRLLKAGLIIDPCDGMDDSNDIFKDVDGIYDGSFTRIDKKEAGEPCRPTGETPVNVYEQIEKTCISNALDLFGDGENICLTKAQVKNFVKKHREWLGTKGCATLFKFKSYNKFFVASVCVLPDNGLHVRLDQFGSPDVWSHGYRLRVVVPQLA